MSRAFRLSVVAFTALVLVAVAPSERAAAGSGVILVPTDQPTIQAAIAAAVDGDVVRVAAGTYFENIDFLGKAIVVESEAGAAVTTIDGSALTLGPDLGSVVRFVNGETPDSELRGFTITGGTGTLSGSERYGGGIYFSGAQPRVVDNVITGNDADRGGGLYSSGLPSARIERNQIVANTAARGGGVYTDESSPLFVSNSISNNTATIQGGGLDVFFLSNPTLNGNTITGNSAPSGAGIFAELFSDPAIFNTIVWGNIGGSAISPSGSSPTVSFSIVEGGWPGVTLGGNLDADPLFVDALAGDYTLAVGSPAIGAGSNSAPFLPVLDLSGNDRIVCSIVDMGAYESAPPPSGCPPRFVRGECDGDGAISISDALRVLAVVFAGDPAPCALACDVNDDDTIDVADAIYLLEAQFVAGSPVPTAPFPECGIDPSGSPHGCVATGGCTP